jgi:hypothetical protein
VRDDVRAFLVATEGQLEAAQKVMGDNGFVFDNLNDPWQKLAFTFYTDIVQMSLTAKWLLAEAAGGEG